MIAQTIRAALLASATAPINFIVQTNTVADAFTRYQFSFVAGGAFSDVYFGGWDVPGFQYVDDVFVTKAPEPLKLSLFGAGLIGTAAMRRRRKKSA